MSIKTEICQAYLRTSDHLIGFTLILIVIWLKQPSSNIPFLRAELHSYFHDFTSVCLIRNQIAFFINLLQSLLGSPIQFEFEYIYIFRRFYYCVRAIKSYDKLPQTIPCTVLPKFLYFHSGFHKNLPYLFQHHQAT